MKTRTCNYCGMNMEYHADLQSESVPSVCANPACPAFALLQICAEAIPDSIEKKK